MQSSALINQALVPTTSDEIVADKEINKPEEMTADEIILKNKKKGRKSTVLTSVTGVEGYPTLSKKSLLGG